jgi:hypothetical protein
MSVLVVALTRQDAISSDRREGTLSPTSSFVTLFALVYQLAFGSHRRETYQKNWSPNHGLIKVGIPARRLAPTVPAPP